MWFGTLEKLHDHHKTPTTCQTATDSTPTNTPSKGGRAHSAARPRKLPGMQEDQNQPPPRTHATPQRRGSAGASRTHGERRKTTRKNPHHTTKELGTHPIQDH